MDKEAKKKEIKALFEKQKQLLKKIEGVFKLPVTKRKNIIRNRCFKVFNYILLIRALGVQIYLIQSIALEFLEGGKIAVIEEKGKEIIIKK